MTEFELQSIAVAQCQFWTFVAADVIAALALFAAVVGGILAYQNIGLVLEQLRLSRWNALLSFEQDMANRRSKFSEIAAQMHSDSGVSTEMLESMFSEAKESYFNALDRLCSSILIGHFPDAEMKQDYHETLTRVVREFPREFDPGTRYRKIMKLFNRWQD